jgi:hypothetical protein
MLGKMENKGFDYLIHGFDTLQCAYFMESRGKGIDFELLTREREGIKQTKSKEPKKITLGESDFLLHPFGSSSGYPIIITNEDFKIEMGEFNNPNLFVTFRSQGIWKSSVFDMHDRFIDWGGSVGFEPYGSESLSRIDYCFDYNMDKIDFDEDCFVSRSNKDSKHREDGKPQTFTFGKGDVVLRVYDKVAEIKQQSDKAWFYVLWGGLDQGVWRIEWQVRKVVLRNFGIKTFNDLYNRLGDLLKYLSEEHDTLRCPNGDSNRSRWPMHPLWRDLQERVKYVNQTEIREPYDKEVVLDERMTRITIIMYGYLKRVAAIRCIKTGKNMISEQEALEYLGERLSRIHDPLNWQIDVKKRIEAIGCGEW